MHPISDNDDLSIHNYHNDQVRFEESGQPIPNSPVLSATNDVPIHTDGPQEDSNGFRKLIHSQQKPKVTIKSGYTFNV